MGEKITKSGLKVYYGVVSNITTTPLDNLLKRYRPRNYQKGQVLVYAADQLPQVYILKSGVIKLYDLDAQGDEKIVHLLGAPTVFPLAILAASEQTSQLSYSTLTDCELYLIPSSAFHQELTSNSELALWLIHWFSNETREYMKRISSLERTATDDKLLAALAFLARRFGQLDKKSGYCQIDFPVSHQMLADLIGVTRESTTLAVQELQKARLVRSPRQARLQISQKLVG